MCLPSWTGRHCENHTSSCSLDPCKNNATCHDVEDTFFCTCDKRFTGRHCDVDINECQTTAPCKHGGLCVNTYGSFSCNCSAAWTGELCEVYVDECKHNPCPQNTTCMNKVGGFECRDCSTFQCYNGGTCFNSNSGPVCKCSDDWTSDDCRQRNFCKDDPCGSLQICISTKNAYT